LTRHRLYSATLNRFLSSDPLGLAGGLNLYAYGEGNPLMYIDPLGLCAQKGFGDGVFDRILGLPGNILGILNMTGEVGNGLLEAAADMHKFPDNFGTLYRAIDNIVDAIQNGPNRMAGDMIDKTISGSSYERGLVAGDLLIMLAPVIASEAMSALKATPAVANNTGFMGNKGFELKNTPSGHTRNVSGTVAGREYAGHAFDQMQNRGIMPSVVENTIKIGKITPDSIPGRIVHYDAINNVSVVTDAASGRVITTSYGNLGK